LGDSHQWWRGRIAAGNLVIGGEYSIDQDTHQADQNQDYQPDKDQTPRIFSDCFHRTFSRIDAY
jgi:hypothetical protein